MATLAYLRRTFIQVARLCSYAGAGAAALMFVAMTLLTLFEVLLRGTTGRSTLIASEYSGYALSAMVYLSLGYGFREGAHIRITFVHDQLGARAKRWLELVLSLLAIAVVTFMLPAVWRLVLTTHRRGTVAFTPAETPLYLPQALIVIGLGIFWLQLCAYALELAFQPRLPVAASATASPPSQASLASPPSSLTETQP